MGGKSEERKALSGLELQREKNVVIGEKITRTYVSGGIHVSNREPIKRPAGVRGSQIFLQKKGGGASKRPRPSA